MQFVSASDGVKLFVRDWGGGGRPVVFVHSWALSSQMWQYQTAALADAGYRPIVYDRRGHGRSDVPVHGYDPDTLVDDLARVVTALDLTSVALIGHSMGSGEIVRYAARRATGRVDRIALLAPTTPFILKTADNPDGVPAVAFERLRAQWRKDFGKWMDDNTAPFFTPDTSPGMMRWMTGTMQSTPLDVAIACNKSMVETDFRSDAAAIRVPTLILHGDKDVSAPLPLTGAATARLMPHATLKVYEGAPHGLFVTHMDRVNTDLLGFLASG